MPWLARSFSDQNSTLLRGWPWSLCCGMVFYDSMHHLLVVEYDISDIRILVGAPMILLQYVRVCVFDIVWYCLIYEGFQKNSAHKFRWCFIENPSMRPRGMPPKLGWTWLVWWATPRAAVKSPLLICRWFPYDETTVYTYIKYIYIDIDMCMCICIYIYMYYVDLFIYLFICLIAYLCIC